MTDDRFDRDLTQRLRAYESRLPDAAPPTVDASRPSGMPRWPILGLGALAAIAAVLAVAVLLNGTRDDVGDASPTPSASASAAASEPAPSSTPDASAPPQSQDPVASPSPGDPSADLSWTEVASFGSPDTASAVSSIARHDGGLVAVGVAYEGLLPILGPSPPHEGRVWVSVDGTSWEDATPAGTFENVAFRFVMPASDGALIAHGWASGSDDELGTGIGVPAWWESPDGRSWTAIDSPFPEEAWMSAVAAGAQGTIAVVVEPAGPTVALWWSGDGRAWTRVHDIGNEAAWSIGAGDEGFVVAGTRTTQLVPWAIASADGREWLEAETPPGAATGVAPRASDWVAVSRDPTSVLGLPSVAEVWSSANGLDWNVTGDFPLASIEVSEGTNCTEIPVALFSAGPWLVASTKLSFGCSEGGVQTQGAQLISVDGVTWSPLPFAPISDQVGLGTRISGALEVNGRLVLIGERDRIATFWIGEQP